MVKRKVKKNDSKNTIKIISIVVIVLAVIFAVGYALNKNTELTGWASKNNTGGSSNTNLEPPPLPACTGIHSVNVFAGTYSGISTNSFGIRGCREEKSCGVGAPTFDERYVVEGYECEFSNYVCCVSPVPDSYNCADLAKLDPLNNYECVSNLDVCNGGGGMSVGNNDDEQLCAGEGACCKTQYQVA